jgi:DNA-binding transcriptional ArsR family regulator
MDHETLFTASKWDILKQLERGPASPLELSTRCKTSIANVSQQLRLLEMAGLVTSSRVANRDRGKPRVLYRLAGDLSYMIATSGSFVDKKVMQLTAYHKAIMRIWFCDQPQLHYTLEKAFWHIEEHLEKLRVIAVDLSRDSTLTFHLEWKGKPIALAPFTVTDKSGVSRQVLFADKAPPRARLYPLHDPEGILNNASREEHGDTDGS